MKNLKPIYAAVTLLILASPAMAGINDGLIAYWNFDDCDTVDPVVTDVTGNANNGTVLGSDTNSECVDSAVRGKAYRLIGTTEWSNPSGGNILIPMFPFASWPGFSVCLWVNEEDMLHPHGNAYISWGWSSWSQWVAIGHFADTGTSWPDTLHYIGGTAYPPLVIEFDTVSDRNRFVHHCLVHDNGTGLTRGYKDSVFVGEISQPVVNVHGSLGYIARHYWTAGDVTRFTGIVDEVRVYDRALTASEIEEVFAHGLYKGLVASYPFNGNADEATGAGPDGTVFGATPTEDRFGNPDSAYHFDGVNDYINIGNTLNFPAWDTYSVSVWFLNDGGGDLSNGYGQKIIDKTTWYSDFYLSVASHSSGALVWQTYQGGSGGIVEFSDYRDSTWHHIVINKNGTSGELWVDGQLVGTSAVTKTVTNSQPVLFGYSFSGDHYQRKYWSGKIDDIRVYNRTLTEAEIGDLFTGISVEIDVKPGSNKNPINLRAKNGTIPVAILTTETFDATQVDWETVRFGPSGATERHERLHVRDTDGDGDMDAKLHFKTRDTGIRCGDTEATLTGETFGGDAFAGSDIIETVKCPKNKKKKRR